MRRSLLVLLVSAALLAGAPAAPVPKAPPAPYHPTKPGTRWVYRTGKVEYANVVTAAEKRKDGATVLTFSHEEKDGKTRPGQKLVVSAEGVFRLSGGLADSVPPVCLVKLPFRAGDEWRVDTEVPGQPKSSTRGTATAAGEEEVEVPAGKFKAHRIELDYAWNGVPKKGTIWYSPGVGMVKTAGGGFGETVLVSFTPGKD